jgi:hypothetical protein
MISSEVQRTLVKSPPELWAELSDPVALARHLGELGEIRIVRTEPERKVEWSAQNITGTVSIQASGWGTKVTLSVTQEILEPAAVPESLPEADAQPESPPEADARPPESPVEGETEAEPAPLLEADAEPEPVQPAMPAPAEMPEPPTVPATLATPEPLAMPEPVSFREPLTMPEPAATIEDVAKSGGEPEPRRGFFARLFGRRRRPDVIASRAEGVTGSERSEDGATAREATDAQWRERVPEPAPARAKPAAFAAVRLALSQETFAAADPFAVRPALQPPPERPDALDTSEPEPEPDERIGDISAELMAAEEAAGAEVTAVLAAVLDRLGAAHHRPFSRA